MRWLALFTGLCGEAGAAELLAWFPEGTPMAGERASLHVRVLDGNEAPVVRASGGTIGEPEALTKELWTVSYLASVETARLTVTTADAPPLILPIKTAQLTPSRLRMQEVTGVAGDGSPITIRVTGPSLPAPEDLTVSIAEGQITSIEAGEDALTLTWQPTRDPFARAIPIGILDARFPDTAPTWGVVRLRGRPRIPLQVEPGAKVTVQVGDRTYGPFNADASGKTQPRIEVWPGEDTIDILTEDALGNLGRTRQTLGGDTLPRMLALVAGTRTPALPEPRIFLWAIRPDGRPWRGEAPACFTSDGQALPLGNQGRAMWTLRSNERRLDCTLAGQARAVVEVPDGPAIPQQLRLQVYPTTLTADLPRARVQVFLEDQHGYTFTAEDVQLGAGLGALRMDPTREGQAGEYLGESALSTGSDVVTAAWWRAEGSGAVWGVQLSATPFEGGVQIAGRALNRTGLPVAGVPVALTVGNQEVTASTNSMGWAMTEVVSAGPAVLSAQVGHRQSTASWRPGEALGMEPAAPDLFAIETITIAAGRVREIFLSTEPRVLVGGGGFSADVEVRLEDRAGRPILDEEIILEASVGRLSVVSPEPEGRYLATYTPPEDLTAGIVQITATAGEGGLITATDLRIVPRITRRLTGPTSGWLVGLGELSSPWLSLEHDWRPLKWDGPFFLRLYAGGYRDQITVSDDFTGETISLEQTVLPIGAGAIARQELQQLTGWLGMAVSVAPYYQESRFSGERDPTASAIGIASLPGLQLYGGVGRRFPSGELQGQVGGLVLIDGVKDIGWTGFIGGAWLSAGYKFIY